MPLREKGCHHFHSPLVIYIYTNNDLRFRCMGTEEGANYGQEIQKLIKRVMWPKASFQQSS